MSIPPRNAAKHALLPFWPLAACLALSACASRTPRPEADPGARTAVDRVPGTSEGMARAQQLLSASLDRMARDHWKREEDAVREIPKLAEAGSLRDEEIALLIQRVETLRGNRRSPWATRSYARLIADLARFAGGKKAALPALTRIFEATYRTDPASRYQALRGLRFLGADATPAVPLLARALEHRDRHLRCGVVATLGEIGRGAIPVIDRMTPLLRRSGGCEADAVAAAFARMGEAAVPAVPALMSRARALRKGSSSLIDALASIGRQAPQPVIDAAVPLLYSSKASDRETAARVLGTMGAPAAPALTSLQSCEETARPGQRRGSNPCGDAKMRILSDLNRLENQAGGSGAMRPTPED